jgi:hypothetical protein
MAFPTDYVVNRENASPITLVSIDNTTPIVGLGSLNTVISDTGALTERLTIQNNTYSNGLTAGRIRSIIEISTLTTDNIGHVGFVCMQNSVTAYNTNDAGYAVVVSGDNGLSTTEVSIVKYNNVFTASPSFLDVASTGVALNTPFVFQMDWISDFPLLGGTLIRGYIGTNSTDFNDLVQVVEATDVSSPLVSTISEGLIQVLFSGAATTFDVKWDETSFFELT